MNYANAINAALGIAPAHAPSLPLEGATSPPPAKVRAEQPQDIGRVESGSWCGFNFLVRENGCSTIWPDAGKLVYWHIFFYTDEELRVENARGNVEKRVEICKRAIERFLAGAQVYNGPWHLRNLNP